MPVPIPLKLGNLVFGSLGALASIGIIKLFLNYEKKTFSDIGLVWDIGSLRKFLSGLGLGIVLIGIMLFVMVVFTSLEVERVANPDYWDAIGFSFLVLFALALMEEIAFRSYPFVRLNEFFGPRTAIYCTSVFFAFYHGWDVANLLGPGVWGLFFGLTALKSGGIALPLGFHFALNWVQSFFGMKTQFATAIWTLEPGPQEGFISFELLGTILQVVLLVAGVLLIEQHIRKQSN